MATTKTTSSSSTIFTFTSRWSTLTPEVARVNIRLVSFMCGKAADALIKKCQNPEYVYPSVPNVRCFLSAYNLIQEDGSVSDTVKNVVLQMLAETTSQTQSTAPLQKEVSKIAD
ncbi:MAG TPA: hypothetical protein VLG44_02740 [Chlamydiales bacterium]|nr:hypothetical protein [Chlamydiales bacterium]